MAKDEEKIVTKKASTKKASTKKVAARKAAARKSVPKKTATKKVAATQTAKKATTRKTVSKKATPAAQATHNAALRRAPAPVPAVASGPSGSARPNTQAPRPTHLPDKQVSIGTTSPVSPEERLAMIEEAAYYKAEKHEFDSKYDQQNWQEATREIDSMLARRGS